MRRELPFPSARAFTTPWAASMPTSKPRHLCPACLLRANAQATACTARTASAPIRWLIVFGKMAGVEAVRFDQNKTASAMDYSLSLAMQKGADK